MCDVEKKTICNFNIFPVFFFKSTTENVHSHLKKKSANKWSVHHGRRDTHIRSARPPVDKMGTTGHFIEQLNCEIIQWA